MKWLALIALWLVIFAGAAFAQQPAPYVPITLDETTFAALKNYLGEQPNKIAGPMVNLLDKLEADAKAAADKPKEPEPKK